MLTEYNTDPGVHIRIEYRLLCFTICENNVI